MIKLLNILNEAEIEKCPAATQNIDLNLKNRQKAINEYGYGPLNPNEPNEKFWQAKMDMWKLDDVSEAKEALCGNCAAFDITSNTWACIAKGIGSDEGSEDPFDVIDAGKLGYCRFLKFKCAAARTCDAWVVGGPLTDTKTSSADGKEVEEATYHTMGLKQIRVVIEGDDVPEKHAKIIKLLNDVDPDNTLKYFPATGKIVGNFAQVKAIDKKGISLAQKRITDNKIDAAIFAKPQTIK